MLCVGNVWPRPTGEVWGRLEGGGQVLAGGFSVVRGDDRGRGKGQALGPQGTLHRWGLVRIS